MKKLLSIVASSGLMVSSLTYSFKNSSISNISSEFDKNIKTENHLSQRASTTNLSRVRINDFVTDLSIFDNKELNRQDYLEEIKWGMIDSNSENEDLLFEIWDSVLYDYPDKWEFSGIDWVVPEKGNQITVRIRLTPIDFILYSGSLSFKTTLVNEVKNIQSLSNLVKNTSIGTIENNTTTSLRERVEEKNSASNIKWDQIRITSITENDATLQAIDNSLYYKGAVNINFKIGKQLDQVVKNLDLGKIEEEINESLILRKVKEKNISVLTEQIKVSVINESTGTALLVPLNDHGEYVGQVEVRFVNLESLESAVKNKFLGYFLNPTRTDLIEKIVSLNPKLKRTDFTINSKTLTYSNVEIIATSSSKFYGQATLTFTTNITTGITYNSEMRKVEAYASTYTDIKTDYLYYTPEFGKEALLKKYTKINYLVKIHRWINHGDNYEDETIIKTTELNLTNYTEELYGLFYSSTNWMKAYSSITQSWSGNKINFKIITGAEAFASGWNALWAKAEAKTEIKNIWFS